MDNVEVNLFRSPCDVFRHGHGFAIEESAKLLVIGKKERAEGGESSARHFYTSRMRHHA